MLGCLSTEILVEGESRFHGYSSALSRGVSPKLRNVSANSKKKREQWEHYKRFFAID